MKHKKVIGHLVTAVEVVLLVGMLLLSFYLLIQYMEEGEQAVSGTAISVETEPPEEEESDLVQSIVEDSLLIRVRILDDAFEKDLFQRITVTAAEGFTAEWGMYDNAYNFESSRGGEGESEKNEIASVITYEEDEIYTVTSEELSVGEALRFVPGDSGAMTVTSLMRAEKSPEYKGELYIYRLEDGLALVNVLELEEYLYAVVSSEMPSYFPTEALKAQAVCARTYVILCIENQKNENSIADLDDSVRFQVYNNREATEATRKAVDATRKMILTRDEVLYYSTSCLSEHREDLGEETAFRSFLSEIPDEGAEYGSAWVRWETEIPVSRILERLADTCELQAETLEEISVEFRSGNGQVLLLRMTAGGETVEIEGEYAIRQFLFPTETGVKLMDGTTASGLLLLPSAFFWLELEGNGEAGGDDTVHIYGGGYGHGNGMSQYGAAQMAAEGASYLEILEYYY
ncbi:MAG: SpoIID/LytB domain-containing protein [Lachnospiraceae bacterium]|nr:SpoIID/LytB domain-containing protein [Lachnospiraceae bacterium]